MSADTQSKTTGKEEEKPKVNLVANEAVESSGESNNNGQATLRRRTSLSGIDDSEGKILLRQIDDRGTSSLTTQYDSNKKNNNNQYQCCQPVNEVGQMGDTCNNNNNIHYHDKVSTLTAKVSQQEDSHSYTTSTTTSDINSEDDATSIVSRLSQIVVEQEGKLFCPLNQQRQERSEFTACNRTSSSNFYPNDSVSHLNTTVSTSALPEILVSPDKLNYDTGQDEQHTGKTNKSNRLRAKSVVENQRRRVEQSPSPTLYTTDSTNFLPERGNLKALENSRKFSCTNGSASKQQLQVSQDSQNLDIEQQLINQVRNKRGSIDSETMLNIRRSTWTLSEFDETFYKQLPALNTTDTVHSASRSQDYSLSDRSSIVTTQEGGVLSKQLEGGNLQNNRLHSASSDKLVSNGNLLMLASKNHAYSSLYGNTLSLSSLANGQQPGVYATNHTLPINNQQHPSTLVDSAQRRFSSVSFASSDSNLSSYGQLNKRRITGNRNENDSSLHDQKKRGDKPDRRGASCARSVCSLSTLKKYIPILEWLPAYKMSQLPGDAIAGFVVAILNVSINLSTAVVAETEPSFAFRTSIISTFVYSILCSSRHTSFGSMSIISQMMVVSVKLALSDELLLTRLDISRTPVWEPAEYERWHLNLLVMYTFLMGLVQLISGILNLGNLLASFIPEALGSSLIAATGFTMAIGQLANMCGTSNKIIWSIERNTTALWADLKNPPVDITDLFAGLFKWVKQIALLIKYHEQINMICVTISIVSLILLFLNQYLIKEQLENLFKRKILIPCEVVIVVIMIIISYSFELKEKYNVRTCGAINIDFSIPTLPDFKLIRELWFESLAAALISYSMVYVASRQYSNKFNYDVDYNQELIACGAGNLVGGLFDSLPATASFSRTSSKVEAGGQTQLASIINCLILLILAHFLGYYIAFLPVCTTSAALFFGFVRMAAGARKAFVYWRICKVDFSIWIFNFVAILTLDLVNGFVYGFIFSILTMLYRAQNRRCYMLGSIGSSDVYVPLVKYPLAQEIEGIKIFQFCGPIHYVCADLFERLLRQKTRVNVKQIARDIMKQQPSERKFNPSDLNLPTHIILDFSMISFIDTAGLNIIRKIIEDYKKINITILIASLASHVASIVKSDSDLWNNFNDRFYITLADAVHCALRDRRIHEIGISVKS